MLSTVIEALAGAPLLVLFGVLAIGTALGAVHVAGVSVGPAGALFAGLAVSAAIPGVADALPTLVGTLGLTLFAYTIGLAGGPSFASGFRSAAPTMAAAVGLVVLAAAVAVGMGRLLGLSSGQIAGTFAGAVTNTPALAAAQDAVGSTEPVVGYSIAYPFGVIGAILGIVAGLAWARRRPNEEDRNPPQPAAHTTVEITRTDRPSLDDLRAFHGETLVFSRVRRDGRETTPTPGLLLEPGDLVTVVGPAGVLEAFAEAVGTVATEDLPLDRHQIDFRRIVLTNPRYAGARVADLDLSRFQAVAGYVRRGDVDLVARPDLVVELGDRIRVVAPRDELPAVVRELGNSERAAVTADPIGFSLGLALGLALGLVPIPLPGLTIQLGTAAAPLIVGLVLGRIGHTGSISWQLPFATNQALRQFGVLVFLASVGLGAGPDLLTALRSGEGLALVALGAVITSVLVVSLLGLARAAGRGGARIAGTLAGAQGQPAVLSFAGDRTEHDDRVNLVYAQLFPVTFIAKILCAQVLASL
ncbi:MAG: transporter [Nitriliruptoraceae bacterium]|nr:transporter [Nitriliruptoraceae bacterium]